MPRECPGRPVAERVVAAEARTRRPPIPSSSNHRAGGSSTRSGTIGEEIILAVTDLFHIQLNLLKQWALCDHLIAGVSSDSSLPGRAPVVPLAERLIVRSIR